ncbi:MAG TPA: hypothetical protein VMV66_00570 [Candidatus Humimicrobiaceae bacterium]|nr:hypothetical protein [Candidatus Humimicrobiaceae bacterium]
MKKDKIRLILITTGTILLLIALALYGYTALIKKEATPRGLIPILIPLIVIIFMMFFIGKRYKDVKEGMPMEDERSKKVITQAAAKSFYFSLYWLLAISWFEPFFARVLFGGEKLDAGQTVGGGIAGMAIFFFIFWFYYDKKGKLI